MCARTQAEAEECRHQAQQQASWAEQQAKQQAQEDVRAAKVRCSGRGVRGRATGGERAKAHALRWDMCACLHTQAEAHECKQQAQKEVKAARVSGSEGGVRVQAKVGHATCCVEQVKGVGSRHGCLHEGGWAPSHEVMCVCTCRRMQIKRGSRRIKPRTRRMQRRRRTRRPLW